MKFYKTKASFQIIVFSFFYFTLFCLDRGFAATFDDAMKNTLGFQLKIFVGSPQYSFYHADLIVTVDHYCQSGSQVRSLPDSSLIKCGGKSLFELMVNLRRRLKESFGLKRIMSSDLSYYFYLFDFENVKYRSSEAVAAFFGPAEAEFNLWDDQLRVLLAQQATQPIQLKKIWNSSEKEELRIIPFSEWIPRWIKELESPQAVFEKHPEEVKQQQSFKEEELKIQVHAAN